MPVTTYLMFNIPSGWLNFTDIMLRNGKIMPATIVIMFNIPSVGLNFADIMPNFGFRDPIFGLLEP